MHSDERIGLTTGITRRSICGDVGEEIFIPPIASISLSFKVAVPSPSLYGRLNVSNQKVFEINKINK